jgi:hypothetical protein
VEHPKPDQWVDSKDGGCRLTLDECDYLFDGGCEKCPRSIEMYLKVLIDNEIPLPWKNNRWDRGGFVYTLNSNSMVGKYESTEPEKVFVGPIAWWFKHLKEYDPCTWDVQIKMCDCPYAFALMRLIGPKTPKRVLWAPELILIFVFEDCMYVITGTSWHGANEIKQMYEGVVGEA